MMVHDMGSNCIVDTPRKRSYLPGFSSASNIASALLLLWEYDSRTAPC